MYKSDRHYWRISNFAYKYKDSFSIRHLYDCRLNHCTPLRVSIYLYRRETDQMPRTDSLDYGHFEKSKWTLGVCEENIPGNWNHCPRIIVFVKRCPDSLGDCWHISYGPGINWFASIGHFTRCWLWLLRIFWLRHSWAQQPKLLEYLIIYLIYRSISLEI